jgi:cystathionine beta-lyase/cystathionine gamma-synthase
MRTATKFIHHPGSACPRTGALSTPIYQVSTFKRSSVDQQDGYDYSRTGNPTRDVLERYIATVEEGAYGFAFSSGMAAISTCLMVLETGNHILATEGLYGGTYRLLTRLFPRFGIESSFVNTGDINCVERAVRDTTRAILIETPSNPTMNISDIARLSAFSREHDILLIVDNTFMSPYLQRPLTLAADIVIHSATKYLGGHSDLIAGLVVVNDDRLAKQVQFRQNSVGAVPSPFDCWLLIRGMKTLKARMTLQQESARTIAEWLLARDEVERVLYPGLDTHPGHDIQSRQASGGGAMVSFVMRDRQRARQTVHGVKLWSLAVSLGGVESIITLPARMTHLSYSPEERERLGIDDRLIRLSVGLEDVEDLIDDLEQAMGGG